MSLSWTTAALATVALAWSLAGCWSHEDEPGSPSAMNESLDIWFPTLYSAYIPGSPREFRVPAVVDGVPPDRWEIDPPDAAYLEPNREKHSVMITMRKAGRFTLTAHARKRVGTAELVVTEATEEQLARGEQRFNNGIPIDISPIFGRMSSQGNAACTNCHGQGASTRAVEITPQQLGGYSDDELVQIISAGMKPIGAMYNNSLLAGVEDFSMFHRWTAATDGSSTVDPFRALVVYLRSLEPVSSLARQNITGAAGAFAGDGR